MAKPKYKRTLDIAKVAHEAEDVFVSPKPLPTNETVRQQIVMTTPTRPLRRVCLIEKTAGFSFFTTTEDRTALDYIAFLNKIEKQNVVRAALNQFLQRYYTQGQGLSEEGKKVVAEFEKSAYTYV